MKKKFTAVILTLVFAISAFMPCMASDGDIKIMFNGQELFFDAKPTIIAGRTLVPMRPIFVTLGYDVQWNEENRSIKATRGSDEINMYIDFYTMWSNGNAIPTDVPPCIINDRTFVPLRAVSEMSGCGVEWNESERIVYIDTSVSPSPSPSASPATESTPEPTVTPKPTPQGITLDVTSVTIDERKTYTLKPTVMARLADSRIRWYTSDAAVATVSSEGVVSAIEEGVCTITAKAGSEYAECEVTVRNVPKRPNIDIKGYNTTKLFVQNRGYVTITIFNAGEYPVVIKGDAEYKYLDGAESTASNYNSNDIWYDIYTMKLKSPEISIGPKSYEVITFTRTSDAPSVGSKTHKADFNETLSFAFEYDGKDYTGEKIKLVKKPGAENPEDDFRYY